MKKSKKIIGIILTILILIVLIFFLIANLYNKKNNFKDHDNSSNEKSSLLGEERLEGQNETVESIKNYIKDIDIINYAKNNKLSIITIQEIQEKFKLDNKEFEELPYNCNSSGTFLLFNEEYTNYSIVLDCKSFYLE